MSIPPGSEQKVADMVREMLRDQTERNMKIFADAIPRIMGATAFSDWTPRERLAFYLRKPPIDGNTGWPPQHNLNLPVTAQAPDWEVMALELPQRYEYYRDDFIKLMAKELE